MDMDMDKIGRRLQQQVPPPPPPAVPPPAPPLPPPIANPPRPPPLPRSVTGHAGRGRRMAPLPPGAADSVPTTGIPLSLPRKLRHNLHPRHILRSLSAVPFAWLTLILAAGIAAVGLVFYVRGTGQTTYFGARRDCALFFVAGELAAWAAVRILVALVYYLVQARAYSTLVFYVLERSERDLTFVAWGLLSLLITPAVTDGIEPDTVDDVTQLQLTLTLVFVAHLAKNAGERVYLQSLHLQLYGRKLLRQLEIERTVCNLRHSVPANADAWVTPPVPHHTHRLNQTMRALLGDILDESPFVFSPEVKRIAAASRAADIFENLDATDSGFFTLADVERVLGPDGALDAMAHFAPTRRRANLATLEVTYDTAVERIFEMFESRERIYKTLHERGQLSNVLHRASGVVFWMFAVFVILVVYLGLTRIFELVLPLATFALGLAFVIADSAKAAFKSFVLLFVRAPFIVGDRITIPGHPTMIVDSIFLLQTVVHTTDGRVLLLPNSKLATEYITSFQRSKTVAITARIPLQAELPPHILASLRNELLAFVREDSSAPWDFNDFLVWLDDVDHHGCVWLNVWVGLHGATWTASSLKLTAKSKLIVAAQRIVSAAGIAYARSHTIPVELVAPPVDVDPGPDLPESSLQTAVQAAAAAAAQAREKQD